MAVRADLSVITAFVVPKPDAVLEAEDIMAWCFDRLATYKCPREVRFLAALPRTANGKVQRKRLASASTDA
jgi:acyl-CoA synthetase (AMP-forming)/AMP-acid ligase II